MSFFFEASREWGGAKTTGKKSDIAERASAPSPMPEGLADVLGKRDLRNVVEYLSSLK
jgi:quinoprotein glucose dehydrogenase